MTADKKVYELAESFLSDEPRLNSNVARIYLSRAIQAAIDDELDYMRSVCEEFE